MAHQVRYRVRLRVRGELTPALSGVLADLVVAAEPEGTTLVSGELVDQTAVHGLFASIRDLGLSLISIGTVAVPSPQPEEVSP